VIPQRPRYMGQTEGQELGTTAIKPASQPGDCGISKGPYSYMSTTLEPNC
jgi:hypothetical protein